MKFARVFFRLFLGLVIIFSILFTFFIGKIKINQKRTFNDTENYKGILTVWQIDSFEGGTGSRKQFLLKAARSFERKNQGVLIMVIEHTEESYKEEIKKGNMPDLISFGAGIEITNFSELNIKNVAGGMIGEKTYAVAWCRGGYALIGNPKLIESIENDLESVLVSQAEYTQPISAFYLEGFTTKNIKIKKPMDAYIEFVSGKTPYFLGTQRDIIRLERRNMEVVCKPLTKYNDIYQYVAITSQNATKIFYAQSYIKHLLNEEVQKNLNEIGMLSTITNVEYNNPHLVEMQRLTDFNSVSAFSMAHSLKEMQENSLLLIGGKKELEIKIKNMLV